MGYLPIQVNARAGEHFNVVALPQDLAGLDEALAAMDYAIEGRYS